MGIMTRERAIKLVDAVGADWQDNPRNDAEKLVDRLIALGVLKVDEAEDKKGEE